MSSASEAPVAVSDDQDLGVPLEIHQCVQDTLAGLNIQGLEFLIERNQELIKVTIQTKQVLAAQDLAVDLGKKIEQIAPADILELAIYKRKHAEAAPFLIKKMALGKPEEQTAQTTEFEPIPTINYVNPSVRPPLERASSADRPKKLVMYGMLNSYLLRTFSAFAALGIGIFGVYSISRIFDGMEQKPLTYIDVKQLPGLGTIGQTPEAMHYQVAFPRGDAHPSRLWIYLPKTPAQPKIPCVFIPARGTAPLYGMRIDEERSINESEYLAYVTAGYGVIVYDVDGDIDDIQDSTQVKILSRSNPAVAKRLKAYKAADAGALNAKLAIDYAIARIPQIDPNALYTAGAGAGGTLSLLVAATDNRVKGAIAYTPVTNLPKQFPDLIESISQSVPGYKEFIDRSSPHNNAAKITKPLFIFHNELVTSIPLEDTQKFVDLVGKNNKSVTFTHAQVKDPYDFSALIGNNNQQIGVKPDQVREPSNNNVADENIKQAIEWLKSQPK